MIDKEMRKLSRADLLELLLEQRRENEKLRAQLKQAKKMLASRQIEIANAGSIAEAALQLSGVFEAAQEAADQYLENVRRLAAEAAASGKAMPVPKESALPKREAAASPETAAKKKEAVVNPETTVKNKGAADSPETIAKKKEAAVNPETAAKKKETAANPETAVKNKETAASGRGASDSGGEQK